MVYCSFASLLQSRCIELLCETGSILLASTQLWNSSRCEGSYCLPFAGLFCCDDSSTLYGLWLWIHYRIGYPREQLERPPILQILVANRAIVEYRYCMSSSAARSAATEVEMEMEFAFCMKPYNKTENSENWLVGTGCPISQRRRYQEVLTEVTGVASVSRQVAS